MIRKENKRVVLLNAVKHWCELTNNQHFTTIDIINSGVISVATGSDNRRIPLGFSQTYSSVNGGLCELERKGFLNQIIQKEEGQMRVWRYSGKVTA